MVPVINENDTTATDEITFGDNDFLAAQVALLLDARLLVLLTNIDGLHTADPALDPEAELIAEVSDFAELDALEIGDRTSAFGSGGMRSKVAAAEMASEAGIPAVICNGTRAGTLVAAAGGEAGGTRFAAAGGKASSFKLWLKYAKPARGRVSVDEGAARVLRERGSSLLPVGIAAVDGDLRGRRRGRRRQRDGELIGKGISEYSSRELARVIGMQSAEVREVLPHAADEVIHRDRFVLARRVLTVPSVPLTGDGCDHHHGCRDLRVRKAGRAGSGEHFHRGQERRPGGDRAAARRAQRRDPRGQRGRPRRRACRRPHRRAARPPDADARSGSRRWPTGCGRSPNSTTRSARSWNAGLWPAGSTCASSGCRWGSSPSSTRRAPT